MYMKRIKTFILIIFSLLIILLIYDKANSQAKLFHSSKGFNDNIMRYDISIPGNLSHEEKDDLLAFIIQQSQQESFIVEYDLYEDLVTKSYLSNSKDNFLNEIKMNKKYQFYYIFDYHHDTIQYSTLDKLDAHNDLYGNLYIYSFGDDNIEKFIYKLQTEFSYLTVSVDEHYNESLLNQEEASQKYILQRAFIIISLMILLYITIVFVDISKKQNYISIYKFHGDSSLYIYWNYLKRETSLFGVIFIFLYMLSMIIPVTLGIMLKVYLSTSFIIICIVFVIWLLFSIIYGILIKNIKIYQSIKKSYSYQFIVGFHFILKGVFVFLSILFLYHSFTYTCSIIDEYTHSQILLDKVNTMVRLESYSTKVSSSPEEMMEYSSKISKILEESHKAISINALRYNDSMKFLFEEENVYDPLYYLENAIIVNPHYLEVENILDLQRKPIYDANRDYKEKPVIYVPESMMNDIGVKSIQKNPDLNYFEFIPILDNQEVYSYQPGYIKSRNGFIKNSCIIVDGYISLEYCLIDVGTENLEEGFEKWCQENQIDPEGINVEKVENDLIIYLEQLKHELMIYAVGFIIGCIGLIILIYQFLSIYLDYHLRKIFILTIHGESVFYKYSAYFEYQLYLYTLMIFVCFIFKYIYFIPFCIVVLFIDYFIAYMIMKRIDKQVYLFERSGEL